MHTEEKQRKPDRYHYQHCWRLIFFGFFLLFFIIFSYSPSPSLRVPFLLIFQWDIQEMTIMHRLRLCIVSVCGYLLNTASLAMAAAVIYSNVILKFRFFHFSVFSYLVLFESKNGAVYPSTNRKSWEHGIIVTCDIASFSFCKDFITQHAANEKKTSIRYYILLLFEISS